jgi:hypothetical protein
MPSLHPMDVAEAEDRECGACLGEKRVWVRSNDPQDDYEVPCPDCNPDAEGFSKSELAYIDNIRRRNARLWRRYGGSAHD